MSLPMIAETVEIPKMFFHLTHLAVSFQCCFSILQMQSLDFSETTFKALETRYLASRIHIMKLTLQC